MSNNKKTMPPG